MDVFDLRSGMFRSLPPSGDQLFGQAFDVSRHVLSVDLSVLVEVVEVYRNRILGCRQLGQLDRVKSLSQMANR